jgi:dihydrolipoamide dehydrogenase
MMEERMERRFDVAIIGAGTAGLSALSQVRKVTDNFVLIDGGTLGTTCARVGCMPSKVIIQVAQDFYRWHALVRRGLAQGKFLIDHQKVVNHVRGLRDEFVGDLLEGLAPWKDRLLTEYAEFLEPSLLKVGRDIIRADKIVIATGSRPLVPAQWRRFNDRILTTDTLFEQHELPSSIAVIGLGAIGLEMGQALVRLGVNVAGFDLLAEIGGLEDPEINRIAVDTFGKEFPLHLGEETQIQKSGSQLRITSGPDKVLADKILLSIGRIPNLEQLRLDRMGVELDEKGLPPFDRQTMQIGDLPVFIAGDVNGYRPVLHEAIHEGKVAGYNATHDPPVKFKRKIRLNIAFADPNICSVGTSWSEVKDTDPVIGTARCQGGREKILGQENGMIRLYGDKKDGRILGAEMVAPGGEHLAHMLAWCIEWDATVFDLLEMPFYHPVVEETLETAMKDLARKIKGKPNRQMRGFKTT